MATSAPGGSAFATPASQRARSDFLTCDHQKPAKAASQPRQSVAGREGVGLGERDAPLRDRLLARDLEHRLVDVAGGDVDGRAGDELRPVARAARDLEDAAPREELRQALAQPGQLLLALGLVVDALVLPRALRVVGFELRACTVPVIGSVRGG